MFRSTALVVLLVLAGCRFMPTTEPDCVGEVMSPPSGMVEVQDDALLAQALGNPGQGKLCTGKVFQAQQPVTVYRVWNQAKSYTAYGRWWSFDEPQGPRAKYRRQNDICPSWSSLDVMSACELKSGAKVVVGPGQSVVCKQASVSYPQSAVNQVFIPNDSRAQLLWVEDCDAGQAWP